MAKRQCTDKPKIDKTQVVVAVIAAIAAVIVGYWQFVLKPSQQPVIPAPASQQVEYIGRVLDGSTEAPIRGAKVTFDFQGAPPIVYTDSEGIYRFTISIEGDKLAGRVRIEATGYENYDRNITLLLNNPNIEDIRLRPISEPSITPAPTMTPTPAVSTATPTATSITPPGPTPVSTATLPPTPSRVLPTTTATVTPISRMWQKWVKLGSFPSPGARPSGVIRVADSLWVVIPRDRIYRLNLKGDIIAEADFSQPCEKAAWDGESLWCTNMGNTIVKVDPASGEELASFEADMNNARITWDGSALWIIDMQGNLACYDRTGKRLRRLAISVNGWPTGLAWVAGELWVADVHGELTRFDSEFAKIGAFSLTQCGAGSFPYDLALYWDGKSLWLADPGQNRILQCAPAD